LGKAKEAHLLCFWLRASVIASGDWRNGAGSKAKPYED
jgi:hypothetical protein